MEDGGGGRFLFSHSEPELVPWNWILRSTITSTTFTVTLTIFGIVSLTCITTIAIGET